MNGGRKPGKRRTLHQFGARGKVFEGLKTRISRRGGGMWRHRPQFRPLRLGPQRRRGRFEWALATPRPRYSRSSNDLPTGEQTYFGLTFTERGNARNYGFFEMFISFSHANAVD